MIIISSLLLSAFFSGMEIAYVSSNRLNLEIEKNQSGLIPKLLSIITQNPSRFIATMLIGNNFVLVIYGIFMGQFILDNLVFIELSTINELTLVLIQTLISTLVILITAEFIPKVLFQIYSNISMKIFAIPAYFFYTIFYPITSLVTIISNFILKSFFKVNPDDSGISFSKVELENYIENEIEKSYKNLDSEIEIFQNALELSEIKARDIMVPRAEIIALEDSTNIEKVKDLFIETGLSKIPIFKDSIDDIVGYIHSFDFLKKPLNIKEFILPVVFIPEPMLVNDVLEKLTIQRKSIAVVIDEYGGTSGIITVEDIVEELFGEIEDEHDNYDFYEKKISDNCYEFSSRLEIEYLNKTYNLNLPESESYDTLGGLIVFNKEEIPRVGDEILIDDYSIEILLASSSKIEKVVLKKIAQE
jgi:CBS domain containing-hemolysin-like protein